VLTSAGNAPTVALAAAQSGTTFDGVQIDKTVGIPETTGVPALRVGAGVAATVRSAVIRGPVCGDAPDAGALTIAASSLSSPAGSSALAYLGRRTEARDALRPALADADAVGAVLLAQRARRELVATGLRPRQAAVEGAAALTPRQRQVCELAAAGKGNRQIAQALFLSIKTVETHLAAGYRKLGVNTRAELAARLAE
jgi:DNA-binding CsgD family transcriptional regulator